MKNGPPAEDQSNETKLKYYSLYKQSLEGDVKGSQPWAVQLEARAKWDAWAALKGMSQEEAMKQYGELRHRSWLGRTETNEADRSFVSRLQPR